MGAFTILQFRWNLETVNSVIQHFSKSGETFRAGLQCALKSKGQKVRIGLYFLWEVPLAVPLALFPDRRTGTLDTGILVRAGAGAWVFGEGDSASRTEDRADWLTEWGGGFLLLLIGILESRGRLALPFIERKEDDDDEEGGLVWEVGLIRHSVDGEGVLFSSSSSCRSSPSSSGSL